MSDNIIKQDLYGNIIDNRFVVRNNFNVIKNIDQSGKNINIWNTVTFNPVLTVNNQIFGEDGNYFLKGLSQQNLKTNKIVFDNSSLVAIDVNNYNLQTKNSMIELNSDLNDLPANSGLEIDIIIDEYLEKKLFVWDDTHQQFVQKDERGSLLKIIFDKEYLNADFPKLTGDELRGHLEILDLDTQSNSKAQQNLKYSNERIQTYIDHTHVQYVSSTGETQGIGEGKITGQLVLSNDPTEETHQQTKQYIDNLQQTVITGQHSQYILLNSNDSINDGMSLRLEPSIIPTQQNHQIPLRYWKNKLNTEVTNHHHNDIFISTTSATPQVIQKIPRISEGQYLRPQESNIKHETHIQSKSYQDFLFNKNLNGFIYISYQHYLLGNTLKTDGNYTDSSRNFGLYRLKFNFLPWYTEYNQAYKQQMNVIENYPTTDFIVIPIITLSSLIYPSTNISTTYGYTGGLTPTNEDYYDVIVENLIYPEQDKKYIIQFDIGIKGINLDTSRSQIGINVPGILETKYPTQTFTLMFLGGPQNTVMNKIATPISICDLQNVTCTYPI